MTFKIENAEIGLRDTLPAEIDTIFSIESRQENSRFVMAYSRERHLQVIESSDEEHLIIWDKGANELIGFVILAGINNPNRSLEFRRLVINSKGKGYGRQTLRLLKQYCLKQLGFHRMWFDVYEDNEIAIQLYRSEGFKEEGKLREAIKDGNSYRSLLIFSMLGNEFSQE